MEIIHSHRFVNTKNILHAHVILYRILAKLLIINLSEGLENIKYQTVGITLIYFKYSFKDQAPGKSSSRKPNFGDEYPYDIQSFVWITEISSLL